MATGTLLERVASVEDEVSNLKTYAGPGQVQAILDGQREDRAELARFRAQVTKDMNGVKRRLTRLETRMGGLETRMGGLEGKMDEILRRLPEPRG